MEPKKISDATGAAPLFPGDLLFQIIQGDGSVLYNELKMILIFDDLVQVFQGVPLINQEIRQGVDHTGQNGRVQQDTVKVVIQGSGLASAWLPILPSLTDLLGWKINRLPKPNHFIEHFGR